MDFLIKCMLRVEVTIRFWGHILVSVKFKLLSGAWWYIPIISVT